MILHRTAIVLSKFHRLSSVARSLASTIQNSHVRFKHNTTGGSNPRSGRRESGKTHHGKFETTANVDNTGEQDTELEHAGLLEDK